ncbi:MAG: alkaline phosphatase [Thermoproteota archaeon]|nr:alkaline phosphatase [Thermoproteota archaeon]
MFLLVYRQFCGTFLYISPVFQAESKTDNGKIKNVIVMVPDGCGSAQITMARWYKNESLALDEMLCGMVRTYCANSIITDSAPAASAFATGYKTDDGYISVLPDSTTIPGVQPVSPDLYFKPVATVLEGAKLEGKAVGLVATSIVQHATPAAYSAHLEDRRNYNVLAEQQVYLGMDVVFGGGRNYLLPTAEGGLRTDGENLVTVLQSKGYQVIGGRDELLNIDSDTVRKVWGLFAGDAMAHDFDRILSAHQNEPSLAEMTSKAIEILSENKNGFFLFVEGSQVDQSDHSNDPVGVISDFLAFDDAVQVALDFAKCKGHTLVLAFPDHNTGGMTIGFKGTDVNYPMTPYSALIAPLASANLTGIGIGEVFPFNASAEIVREILKKDYGINVTDAEVAKIQAAKPAFNITKPWTNTMDKVVGPMISTRSVIGWTTIGHNGEDLPFYAYGPTRPTGLIENTYIATICAKNLNFNLAKVENRLFVEAAQAFSAIGATVTMDMSDPANWVLVVMKNGQELARLPLSKNVITIGTNTYDMEGRTIYAPMTGKTYVPQQAVTLVGRICWNVRK